jgi:hypothetical protein
MTDEMMNLRAVSLFGNRQLTGPVHAGNLGGLPRATPRPGTRPYEGCLPRPLPGCAPVRNRSAAQSPIGCAAEPFQAAGPFPA